jgi:hypothetical protein
LSKDSIARESSRRFDAKSDAQKWRRDANRAALRVRIRIATSAAMAMRIRRFTNVKERSEFRRGAVRVIRCGMPFHA